MAWAPFLPIMISPLDTSLDCLPRHIGPDSHDETIMLRAIGAASRAALVDAVVPAAIRRHDALSLPAPLDEAQALDELARMAGHNRVLRSHIGQGYYDTHTPAVILRNVIQNPS